MNTNNSKHSCGLTAAATYCPLHRMQRHVHVCVCTHSSLDTFLAAPHQLESNQLPCSISLLAAGAWTAPDARANRRALEMLAHCSTLAPRSAQKKLKLASPQKPSMSMQKIEHLLSLDLARPPSQGVSPWVHTTEPEGSPLCAASSSSHSGCSTVYTSELLSSQSRSSEGKLRSS